MEPKETDGANFREEYDDEDPRMTDLVELTTVPTEAEAMFLHTVLEDADIPSAVTGGNYGAPFGSVPSLNVSVLVPRDLLGRARALITETKLEIERKGVDQAFEERDGGAQGPQPSDDPEIEACRALAALEPQQRDAKLRRRLEEWSAAGEAPYQIAPRLAAAGLTHEQADRLIEEFSRDPNALSEARWFRIRIGITLLLVTAVLLWRGWWFFLATWWLPAAGCFFLAWGVMIRPPKWHTQAPAEPVPPKDDAPLA